MGLWLSCAAVFGAMMVPLAAVAQEGGHAFHPPMPDQKLAIRCHLDGADDPQVIEVTLSIPVASAPAELNQVITLWEPVAPLTVVRYLPQAQMEQEIVPGDAKGALPAIQLSIDGPVQHYKRWLVANDSARNRIVSFIGTWRYMVVEDREQRDELYAQFANELTREPMLWISREDGSVTRELPAKPGAVQTFEALSCTVRIKRFHPHFAIDDKTGDPINRSDKLLNPAALVEVKQGGKLFTRWVFSKFPDFKLHEVAKLPVRVRLDCPLAKKGTTPDFALVTTKPESHEAWIRHGGKTVAQPLGMDKPVEVAGSPYTFTLSKFVAAGVLRESYRPATGRGGVAVVQAETVDAAGAPVTLWLERGKARTVDTKRGPMKVVLDLATPSPTGKH